MLDFLKCHEIIPVIKSVDPKEEHHFIAGM